ncbi:S41 family peptidase [Aurantibacillus circumpalustris]|uniref:S41 family peptidase n=1 Tax=Aurantibacillus circumpalustris TaxID=3036359 RepID=UPI00295BD3C6|nr:S41 family peptidase [Aurantibacillus circumpalustris]
MAFLKRLLIFIFLVYELSHPCYSQKKESLLTKKYSPNQLKEDATVLGDVLLAMHPGIGIYKPRIFYHDLIKSFTSSFNDSLTEKQFRLKTKLFIDEFHCGHSEVLYSKAFYKEVNKLKLNYSPYVFLPVKEQLFMIANLNKKQDSSITRGSEILRINGIAVDSMIRYSRRFISTDGFNQTGKDHYVQLGFNSYFLALFGRPDTFEVEYKKGEVLKTIKYSAIQPKAFPPLPLEPKEDSLLRNYKRANIAYRFLDEGNKSMLLKITKFSHKGDARAYRRIFKKLKKNKSENLIIDLRNNGGGSLGNSYRLLSYLLEKESTQTLSTTIKKYPFKKYTKGNLAFKFTRFAYKIIGQKKSVHDTDNFIYTIKPRKKNHYSNKLFVLINGGSFSASCLVAGYLKASNRAVFIGTETGGAIEGCNAGVTPFYKLPNTKLRVRVPAFRIVHDACPLITGHGILPDYEIKYQLKDILSKQDLEMLKVKELIQNH